MNEVTKLYENAGVLKVKPSICTDNEKFCEGCAAYDKGYIPRCRSVEYPPFTAEKQLELIKWLGKSKNGFGLFNDGTEGLSCHCDFHWESLDESFYAEDFDNALAGLILKDFDKWGIEE